MTTKEDCIGVGEFKKGDEIVARDVMINRDGKTYIVEVATPKYLDLLNEKERGGYLSVNSVQEIDDVCRELSLMSLEELRPFLAPQNRNN